MSFFPNRRLTRRPMHLLGYGLGILLLLASSAAQAIPAFARQTGAACADCHAGSYGGGGTGPNLTPYGMRFKLNGFTDTDGNGIKIPLSIQLTDTHEAPATSEAHTALTEADLYLAGRVTDNIGGFAKVEADHSGHGYDTKLSELDLRLVAKELKLYGKALLLGLSVNNNPGLDDPLAVLPTATFLGPPGGAGTTGTLLNPSSAVALSSRVIGASIYGLYNNNWYGEIGSYRAMPTSVQDNLGYDNDPGRLNDTGYVRLAYMKDLKRQFFSVGLVGLTTRRQLPRTAPADRMTDLGYDLSYQYLGNRENIIQLAYVDILEQRKYGSLPVFAGQVAPTRGDLHDRTLSLTYTFRQAYGVQIAHMQSTGSRDPVRFGPLFGGLANGDPDTTANLFSVFWTAFGRDDSLTSIANLKLSANWFRFTKFNGATENIFGVPMGVPPTRPGDLNAFSVIANLAF